MEGRFSGRLRVLAVMLFFSPLLLFTPEVTSLLPASKHAHPHRGVIPKVPFEVSPKVELSDSDMHKLSLGEMWKNAWESDGVGGGIAVRDIHAPRDVVFDQVARIEEYVGKVPFLKSLRVYATEHRGEDVIEKAEYHLRVPPCISYEYFVEHHMNKHLGILHFFLDYDRKSDFDDMQGKWFLEEHPEKAGWTRAWYQIDMALPRRVPRAVRGMLTNQGLGSAIGWVKKASEEQWTAMAATLGGGGDEDPAAVAASLSALDLGDRASWLGAGLLLVGGIAVLAVAAFRAAFGAPGAARQPTLVAGAGSGTPHAAEVPPGGGLELKAEPFLQA